ncbi:MAG: hypothetical protein ABR94_06085 [Sphingobacteriales bacterium BACL12 MAG-120802-bin5]|jgi:iron complex outermembrane recepter protein|nr:MAG: hypothetical protein ABR94_06085 [Sphingobacteriales bacterium BACL12 MAG-120802-bin5]
MKHIFFIALFICTSNAFAQQQAFTVILNDPAGKPVDRAFIQIPAAGLAAVSDEEGRAEFSLPCGNYAVTISHLVYEYRTQQVRVCEMNALEVQLDYKNNLFQEVTIFGSTADSNVPVTYTNIKGADLNAINYGQDMPFLLNSTPSAVTTSDAGNGIGYTGIRIRGNDATRVNVAINGIPYNDAESHQTFWVNLPDIAASTDDVQIQRGIGTSANGVTATGASINLYTNDLSETPFGFVNANAGSFNLTRISTGFGTGRINDHWFLEGRLSRLKSDGFIDRSFADLSSYFITAGWDSKNYTSIVNVISGKEKTYQSWGGVPKDSLETNRTFNPYTYENQTDNYAQTHVQWHNTFRFNDNNSLNISMNYTRGMGYFEQLEEDQYLPDYASAPITWGDSLIEFGDLITQRWLDNHFAGMNLRYNGVAGEKTEWTAGGGVFYYEGLHFGDVIWSEWAGPDGYDWQYYENTAHKYDANAFVQLHHKLGKQMLLWADIQARTVQYTFEGPTELGNTVDQTVNYIFLNPKAGLQYQWKPESTSYLSVSVASKEPNRDDFVNSTPSSRPNPERLYNLEAGQRVRINGWELTGNLYVMYYQDQLILTGRVNDVGAYTRINVDRSYRAGFEGAWSKWIAPRIRWEGNLALSRNQIINFTEFLDDWDNGGQVEENYDQSTLAFSPSVVGFSRMWVVLSDRQQQQGITGFKTTLDWSVKYVSRQYLDNTTNIDRSLDPFYTTDLQLNATWKQPVLGELTLFARVNNLLNHQYEANGWVYRFVYEGMEQELNGYYPQAGVHFAGGLSWRW